MTFDEAKRRFHRQVVERVEEVDPSGERDWTDMAYGYLLALGFEPNEETAQAARNLEFKHAP